MGEGGLRPIKPAAAPHAWPWALVGRPEAALTCWPAVGYGCTRPGLQNRRKRTCYIIDVPLKSIRVERDHGLDSTTGLPVVGCGMLSRYNGAGLVDGGEVSKVSVAIDSLAGAQELRCLFAVSGSGPARGIKRYR